MSPKILRSSPVGFDQIGALSLTGYSQQLQFLYDLQLFGIKMGLENTRALLAFLGNPERSYPCIHLAGTNGKGSTAAMIASVLTASGYRTGLYTSPHLVSFTERIRVDGKKIPEAEVVRSTRLLRNEIVRLRATFFEATTALAFKYFADRGVDVAVIETGLGGRYDATNVVTPLLSIITSVGVDHTEYLGSTIPAIATEKAGIIKPFVPCLTGPLPAAAARVIEKACKRAESPWMRSEQLAKITLLEERLDGLIVKSRKERLFPEPLFISLAGAYQESNISLALLATKFLRRHRQFSKISTSALSEGLSRIQDLAGLHGRFEVLTEEPLILADVAHNPDATRKLAVTWKKAGLERCVLVFGAMKDKDIEGMVAALAPIARKAVVVFPRTERACPIEYLLPVVRGQGISSYAGGRVSEGIERARLLARAGEPILLCGSHYVVGEAMEHLQILP